MFLKSNGALRFQGVKYGIIVVMRTKQTPYLIEIHYMAHKTNLVIQKLFYNAYRFQIKGSLSNIIWVFF